MGDGEAVHECEGGVVGVESEGRRHGKGKKSE